MLVSAELRRQNVICEHNIPRCRLEARVTPAEAGIQSGFRVKARNDESCYIPENCYVPHIVYKDYINFGVQAQTLKRLLKRIQREPGIRICQSVTFWY